MSNQYDKQEPEIKRLQAWLDDVQGLDLGEIIDLDDMLFELKSLEEKHARVPEPN